MKKSPHVVVASIRASTWWWPAALLLGILTVIVTQNNALFTPPGKLDPWLYLGYFRDLVAFKRNLFPDTYYGSRLPFLLPGAALHALFGPVAAGALFHFLVHCVATFSIFYAAEPVAGRRASLMTALLFAVHPWVWASTGWDNPDGAAMAYFALSMALVARAAHFDEPRPWLAGAGIAAAAAFYTNVFLIALVLFIPLYWVGLRSQWNRRAVARATATAAVWMGVGAVVLTVLLAAVNHGIDGKWNFYGPSLQFAIQKGGASSNPEAAWRDGRLMPWLWFAVAAAAGVILRFRQRWREAREACPAGLLLSIHFLICGGLMWFLQATGPTVLGLYYYASYLLPLTFLSIAVSFWETIEDLTAGEFTGAVAALIVAAAILWSDGAGRIVPLFPDHSLAIGAAVAILLGAALFLQKRKIAIAASLAGYLLLTGYVRDRMPADTNARRGNYAAIGGAFDELRRIRAGRPVAFLLDEQGAVDPSYIELASTFLNAYSITGRRIPDEACRHLPDPFEVVVLASRRPDGEEIAKSGFAPCWSDVGLVPTIETVIRLPLREGPFAATVFRAVHDPARWRPLRPAAADSLEVAASGAAMPIERWKLWIHPHDRGELEIVSGGLRAVTPKGIDYAFTYGPFRVPVNGKYRFTLRYTPVVGSIAFGAYRRTDASWRRVRTEAHPVGDDREVTFLIDLQAGEAADLLIANNPTKDDRRASLVLRELTAGVLLPAR